MFSRMNFSGPGFGSALLLVSITSTQVGTSFAKFLFELVGAEAAVALRLIFATFILFAVLRPWRSVPTGAALKHVVLYGLSIAVMNACFYQAISRIPMGIAVAIEFSGPLLVAASS
ncbi:MAG: EamA family transporter, partial [Mailhella sp.]|nr:EamA family transporter [Mailhella sp.]